MSEHPALGLFLRNSGQRNGILLDSVYSISGKTNSTPY